MARRRQPPRPSPGPIKPYDVILKDLIFDHPRPWLRWAGISSDPAEAVIVLDSNLATVAAESDKIIGVGDPVDRLSHFEISSTYSPQVPRRSNRYNILVECKHELPVWSTLILLRPEADGPALTGTRTAEYPGRGLVSVFRYGVIRLWEVDHEELLSGGLGTLPLAPLGAGAEGDIPRILRAIEEELDRVGDPALSNEVWTCTSMLMGLKYEGAEIVRWLRRMFPMQESSLYRYLMEEGTKKGLAKGLAEGLAKGRAEGRAEEARRLFLRLEERRLTGRVPRSVKQLLSQVVDPRLIERLVDRFEEFSDWDEVEAAVQELLPKP
mgnify:FL=1